MSSDAQKTARESVRQAVKDQLGTSTPEVAFDNLENLARFSPNLPTHYSEAERAALVEEASQLHPWLQGPFYLGGDLVVGGPWRNDNRWQVLAQQLPSDMSNQRVLDVGCNAGYDCFAFNLLQPAFVMGADPEIFLEQAFFLNRIYQTKIAFEKIGWQALNPVEHGLFDIVHCNGVYYHEQHIIQLLQQLAKITAPGGTLFIGGFVLTDPALTKYIRFVPGSFWNDPTWWWVPGVECMISMLKVCGFSEIQEFGRYDVPNGDFPVSSTYFKAIKG